MKSDPVAVEIHRALQAVLEDDAIPLWWGTHVPALGCTPQKAAEEGRAAEILAVARSYADPSFG